MILWPNKKKFAFTIFDDTDGQTLANVSPVYEFLKSIGIVSTKSVWPVEGAYRARYAGSTCESEDYQIWIKTLQKEGFEIGFHNATYHTSLREETLNGINFFYQSIGHYPHTMANHSQNREGIYWGDSRLTGMNKLIYNIITLFKNRNKFQGHIKDSELFWGDTCQKYIKYVRNFIFKDINTLKACPFMPYHDPRRSYVNYWYASSNGPDVRSFNETLSENNQDRLEAEGGACIMYTHFAEGFYDKGQLNPQFEFLMRRLSKKNGWFVPVSTLLDFLLNENGNHEITNSKRSGLELKWIKDKLLSRFNI